MPKFLDLASEVILAITSHIPRSTDKLHLVLVNRSLYHLIIPQLYKSILLGQTGNPSNGDDSTQIQGDSCWDTVRLRGLASVLENKPAIHKLTVESLTLELDSNTLHESLQVSDIMLYLPSLKELCLRSKRLARGNGGVKPSDVSPSMIKSNLRNLSGTLESLIIDIDQHSRSRDGTGLGGFGDFQTLKHLSLQSHLFHGEREDCFSNGQSGDDNDICLDENFLARSLPPRLQKLQMSCWTDGFKVDGHIWACMVTIMLRYLMKWGLKNFPELQDIAIYYPSNYSGPTEVGTYLELVGERQRSRGDKAEIVTYAAYGKWQEVGDMLVDMALREHRNVSVKFEAGAQSGSRAWGEPATEHAMNGP